MLYEVDLEVITTARRAGAHHGHISLELSTSQIAKSSDSSQLHGRGQDLQGTGDSWVELQTKGREDFPVTEKVPTMDFTWLEAPTAFIINY